MKRVSDIVTVRNGNYFTTVARFAHPQRQQKVLVIPAAYYCSQEFSENWVSQPYARDHHFRLCPDLYLPIQGAAISLLKSFNQFHGYNVVDVMELPDAIDNNVSRHQIHHRVHSFSKRGLTKGVFRSFMPTTIRDMTSRWAATTTLDTVGRDYTSHPHEADQSHVIVVPIEHAVYVMSALAEVGFSAEETIEADLGDAATIDMMEKIGVFFSISTLLWISIFVSYGLRYYSDYVATYKEEGRTLLRELREKEASSI